jgi:hypothetical protein
MRACSPGSTLSELMQRRNNVKDVVHKSANDRDRVALLRIIATSPLEILCAAAHKIWKALAKAS